MKFNRLLQMLALVALLRPTDAKKKRSEERTEEDTEETKKLRGSKKADSKDTEDTERAVVTDVPFDCTEEVTLYESADPDPAFSYYNEALQQYVQMDKPLYTDQDLTDLFLTSSAVCQALDEGHLLCNIVTTHEGPEYGITTSTGIAQFEEDGTTGTATFVFTGGTDDFEGITGFVESDYHADGNVHHVCRQD